MNNLPGKCKKILKSYNDDTVCIFTRYWDINDCIQNKDSLFVFGDNDDEKGYAGQAVIRNCSNAIGIPTKKFPNNRLSSFYTDDEYDKNCKKIMNAIIKVIMTSVNYKEIVFPKNGFGVGLANLQEKAPETLKYLDNLIEECFGIDFSTIRKEGLEIILNIS